MIESVTTCTALSELKKKVSDLEAVRLSVNLICIKVEKMSSFIHFCLCDSQQCRDLENCPHECFMSGSVPLSCCYQAQGAHTIRALQRKHHTSPLLPVTCGQMNVGMGHMWTEILDGRAA